MLVKNPVRVVAGSDGRNFRWLDFMAIVQHNGVHLSPLHAISI